MRNRNLFTTVRRALFAVVCVAAALGMVAMPQQASAKKGKKIGIQLYSVMGSMQKDPKGSVDRLAGLGYKAFELVQWGGNPQVFGLDAEEFKAACDAKGIDIISTHSSIQEDPSKEAEIMDNWRKLFAVQKACGGKYFVIPSYRVKYTEADVKQMCDYLNRVGKIAKEEFGLKLGYHNHSQEYKTLEGTDKVFQFGMVRRYSSETAYMKKYIDSGKMGRIVCAEAVRVNRLSEKKGWFAKKALGGGVLKDEAIHHIDELLYLMGYPKILTVSAFASYINNALPVKVNGSDAVPQDTEDVIKAFVTLDNGANLLIRTSSVLLSRRTGVYSEINGEKAGAVILPWGAPPKLEMVEVSDAYTVDEVAPELPDINPMNAQMAHFVDCCVNGAECITKIDEAVALTQLLDAIYESSETGKVVTINA